MLLPIPSVLSIKAVAVAALVAAAVGFGVGWTSNGWRLGLEIEAQKLAAAEALAKAKDEAARQAAAMQKGVDDARVRLESMAATIGERDRELDALRVDVSRLRDGSDRLGRVVAGLRQQQSEFARGAEASHAACLERIVALDRLAANSRDLLERGARLVARSGELVAGGRDSLQGCSRDSAIAVAQAAALIDAYPVNTVAPQP
jgi:hypothetical protein